MLDPSRGDWHRFLLDSILAALETDRNGFTARWRAVAWGARVYVERE